MHAADIAESLPTAGLDEEVLSVIRMVVRHNLPGLVVTDEFGVVVGCVSSVDLLRTALPRYLHGDRRLARVIDESTADRIARTLAGVRVRDVVGELSPARGVRPHATAVELAELMAERDCPIILVERDDAGALGIVTVNHLLELLVATAEDASG
jgi:CBS-domain-containing membrane protein